MNLKVVGAIVIGTCTVALTGYGGMVLMGMEPSAITLNKADESEKYKDKKISENTKFGGIENNKKYLVANIEENKDWWDWVYRNKYQKTEDKNKKTNFQGVTQGYDSKDSTNTLGKKCEEIYKKDKSTLTNWDEVKDNIKNFCTTKMKESEQLTAPTSAS